MPVIISGKQFYRTHEAIEMIGISRSTIFRWFREEKIPEVKHKDHRGWRLFTEKDIESIKSYNETINITG
jgi:predicted site-specific integrase-resolvase